MRRVAVVPLMVLAAALAGCGSTTDNASDFTGAKRDVADAVDDIAKHAARLEAGKICDGFMTTELRNRLAVLAKKPGGRGTTCADQLKESLSDASAFDLDIRSIAIDGRRATVAVRVKTSADDDPTGTLRLANDRGWRLSQLP